MRPGANAIFKNRDFALFLGSRFCAAIATQMIIMAVGWQVYHITGRVLDLGLIGLSQFLPFLCLVLFSGHIADQFDRRKIILLGHGSYALCALLLLYFAWQKTGALPIFAVLAILGLTRAFQSPASQSLLPTIVPAARLGRALAINSSANQVAVIVGPSVGGIVYALAETGFGHDSGAAVVYGAAMGLLLVSILLVALIAKRRRIAARSSLSLGGLAAGTALRVASQNGTGSHIVGPICGIVRRCDGAFTGLYEGRTACRPRDVRLFAGRARSGRGRYGALAGVSAHFAARRRYDVRRRRGIRHGNRGLGAHSRVLGGDDRLSGLRGRGHDQCVCPLAAGAATDA
jgi:MFS family permease